MKVFETARLSLRWFNLDDAPFIKNLLNEPGWKRYIGDRGVNTDEDACGYINQALIASYKKHGFGLFAVERKHDAVLLGMCGLLKREVLNDVDIGFALLSCYEGQGYAKEAAQSILQYAADAHGLTRIVAITTADNHRSIGLLKSIGMSYEDTVRLSYDSEDLLLYSIELARQEVQ